MRFEVYIFWCFLKEKTSNITFLDNRHKPLSKIMKILKSIVSKSFIDDTSLIGTLAHQKRCCLKCSFTCISVNKSTRISVDTKEKRCGSIWQYPPSELASYIGQNKCSRRGICISVSINAFRNKFVVIDRENWLCWVGRNLKCCT